MSKLELGALIKRFLDYSHCEAEELAEVLDQSLELVKKVLEEMMQVGVVKSYEFRDAVFYKVTDPLSLTGGLKRFSFL